MSGGWNSRKFELLNHLRAGLSSADFRKVASSRKSLHVRVHKLRQEGYNIVSEPDPDRADREPPDRVVLYRLIEI